MEFVGLMTKLILFFRNGSNIQHTQRLVIGGKRYKYAFSHDVRSTYHFCKGMMDRNFVTSNPNYLINDVVFGLFPESETGREADSILFEVAWFQNEFSSRIYFEGILELARLESSRLSFLLYILIFSKSRISHESHECV